MRKPLFIFAIVDSALDNCQCGNRVVNGYGDERILGQLVAEQRITCVKGEALRQDGVSYFIRPMVWMDVVFNCYVVLVGIECRLFGLDKTFTIPVPVQLWQTFGQVVNESEAFMVPRMPHFFRGATSGNFFALLPSPQSTAYSRPKACGCDAASISHHAL